MTINQLVKGAHSNAKEKGFYPSGKDRNIGELLMLIVSELGEALEAHRWGKMCNDDIQVFTERWQQLSGVFPEQAYIDHIRGSFEEELADVFIRLADLCGYLEIEIILYPKLEMECFKNVGQELLWWTATLSNLPSFIEYYKENDIAKEIQEISLLIKRMEIFCKFHNIDIAKHIIAKMEYNKTRPKKHGKEY